MMGSARKFLVAAPHVIVFPGVALGLTILSLNLAGDAIRDALDPRQPEYV
jgi:ABC-type dipeptide/oligopeptide/nickel transport system permease subunit